MIHPGVHIVIGGPRTGKTTRAIQQLTQAYRQSGCADPTSLIVSVDRASTQLRRYLPRDVGSFTTIHECIPTDDWIDELERAYNHHTFIIIDGLYVMPTTEQIHHLSAKARDNALKIWVTVTWPRMMDAA